MARNERIALIKEIEKKRGSKVIVYITSDRPGINTQIQHHVIPVIERHARATIGKRTKKLDLVLYSRGGDTDVPWSLVSMLREFLGNRPLGVLIPFRCHSAATVIAIGADEIVMTRMAELGPIDATITRGPHNPRDPENRQPLPISAEDARSFIDSLEAYELKDPTHKMDAFSKLAEKVHPLALGSVNRILSQTRRVAFELMQNRVNGMPEPDNNAVVTKLSSEFGSHAHVIRKNEAVNMGVNYIESAEDVGIEKELWELYEEYSAFFTLEEQFVPNDEMIINDLDERTWDNIPFASVESIRRKDILRGDIRVTRIKEVPPNIQLNMNNLQLAIPAAPQGLSQQQFQTWINQMVMPLLQVQVEQAANSAVNQLWKKLQSKGFQQVTLNTKWHHERTPE